MGNYFISCWLIKYICNFIIVLITFFKNKKNEMENINDFYISIIVCLRMDTR